VDHGKRGQGHTKGEGENGGQGTRGARSRGCRPVRRRRGATAAVAVGRSVDFGEQQSRCSSRILRHAGHAQRPFLRERVRSSKLMAESTVCSGCGPAAASLPGPDANTPLPTNAFDSIHPRSSVCVPAARAIRARVVSVILDRQLTAALLCSVHGSGDEQGRALSTLRKQRSKESMVMLLTSCLP
jgi:hypothetical protein